MVYRGKSVEIPRGYASFSWWYLQLVSASLSPLSSSVASLRLSAVCSVSGSSVASIVRTIFTVQRRRTATRWSAKFLDKLRQLSSKRGRPRPRSRPQLKRDIKSSFASSAVKKISRENWGVYGVSRGGSLYRRIGKSLIEFLFLFFCFFFFLLFRFVLQNCAKNNGIRDDGRFEIVIIL